MIQECTPLQDKMHRICYGLVKTLESFDEGLMSELFVLFEQKDIVNNRDMIIEKLTNMIHKTIEGIALKNFDQISSAIKDDDGIRFRFVIPVGVQNTKLNLDLFACEANLTLTKDVTLSFNVTLKDMLIKHDWGEKAKSKFFIKKSKV